MAFYISSDFHDSFEVIALRRIGRSALESIALWTLAGSWSSAHVTGGILPRDLPPHFDAERLSGPLIQVGLWSTHPRGFQFIGAQERYDIAMRSSRRPSPYVTWRGLCKMPSKAFYDWHSDRGLKFERQPIDEVVKRHVISKHGMTCWLCLRAITSNSELHLDHVVPHSRGGSDEPHNLRPAHALCNIARGVRDPEEFRSEWLRQEVMS